MEKKELEEAHRVEFMDRQGSFRTGIVDKVNDNNTVTLRKYGLQKKQFKTKEGTKSRLGWHVKERVPFEKVIRVLRKKRGPANG